MIHNFSILVDESRRWRWTCYSQTWKAFKISQKAAGNYRSDFLSFYQKQMTMLHGWKTLRTLQVVQQKRLFCHNLSLHTLHADFVNCATIDWYKSVTDYKSITDVDIVGRRCMSIMHQVDQEINPWFCPLKSKIRKIHIPTPSVAAEVALSYAVRCAFWLLQQETFFNNQKGKTIPHTPITIDRQNIWNQGLAILLEKLPVVEMNHFVSNSVCRTTQLLRSRAVISIQTQRFGVALGDKVPVNYIKGVLRSLQVIVLLLQLACYVRTDLLNSTEKSPSLTSSPLLLSQTDMA